MPEAACKDHQNSGPTQQGPSPAVEGSPNVSIGGKPALRVGDPFADGSRVETGAPHVTVNGKAAARKGDKVTGGGTVKQGCSKVRIGDGGGPGYGSFVSLRRGLGAEATAKDRLLLCLPDIAGAEAGRATDADAQGWRYLRSMFYHWFGSPAEAAKPKEKNPTAAPLWVDWDWVMSFWRSRDKYLAFTAKISDPYDAFFPDHIMNMAAQASLGNILCRPVSGEKKYMRVNETVPFDFTLSHWETWKDVYHTLIRVGVQVNPVDGLMAAMGAFTLRALAGGRTEHVSGNRYKVHVEKIAVFVHDVFNFEDELMEYIFGFAFWSCEKLAFSERYVDEYTKLNNGDFRDFRRRHNRGGDFLVLSQPRMVANFAGESYEYTCAT